MPSSSVDPELLELEPSQVEDFLRALASALKSHRLYAGNNPMLDRFVGTLQMKCEALWSRTSKLRLQVQEDCILWENREVYPLGESGSDLPFLFYKDGIRDLIILPGFEEKEALALVGVLARAPVVRKEEDDLITLLWQEDFALFSYETVESTEGIELPAPVGDKQLPPIDPATVRAEEEEATENASADDFQDALQYLNESELSRLREELTPEAKRDFWRDVLNGLLDRLEDSDPARQRRIIGILRDLLPSTLATAEFERAATLLEELIELAGRQGVLSTEALRDVRGVFDQLGQETTITQIADNLERMPNRLTEDGVNRLFGYFPPGSIGPLIRAADKIEQPAVRRAFEQCIQRLAEANRGEIVDLLSSPEPAVIAASLRWLGRLQVGSAAGEIVRFLQHDSSEVKIAAVDALVAVEAAEAASNLLPLLQASNRDVRIAAVRGLGALSYTAARVPIEEALASKRLREADRLEKVAFFEAYGRVAGAEGVPTLDKILNSKNWIGRAETPEIRACAALGLARIRHASARQSLSAAVGDSDPVVRTAVARALQDKGS